MAKQLDADDMFEDTRMSFGDHLEELRSHLWRAVAGFMIALFFSFFIGKFVLRIIAAPVEEQMAKFYERRAQGIADDLADPGDRYRELSTKESRTPGENDELTKLKVTLTHQELRSKETLTEAEKSS